MNKCCFGECENFVINSNVEACKEHEALVLELYEEESKSRSYREERWFDYNNDIKEGIKSGNSFKQF